MNITIGGSICTNIDVVSNQEIDCDFNVVGVGSNLPVLITLNNSNGAQAKQSTFSYSLPTVTATTNLPESGTKKKKIIIQFILNSFSFTHFKQKVVFSQSTELILELMQRQFLSLSLELLVQMFKSLYHINKLLVICLLVWDLIVLFLWRSEVNPHSQLQPWISIWLALVCFQLALNLAQLKEQFQSILENLIPQTLNFHSPLMFLEVPFRLLRSQRQQHKATMLFHLIIHLVPLHLMWMFLFLTIQSFVVIVLWQYQSQFVAMLPWHQVHLSLKISQHLWIVQARKRAFLSAGLRFNSILVLGGVLDPPLDNVMFQITLELQQQVKKIQWLM